MSEPEEQLEISEEETTYLLQNSGDRAVHLTFGPSCVRLVNCPWAVEVIKERRRAWAAKQLDSAQQ